MRDQERARLALPAHGRALRLALLTLAGAWPLSLALAPFAAAAGTQRDALAYLDPAVTDAREELAWRERAATPPRGLDASVTASPSVGYGTLVPGEVALTDPAFFDPSPTWSGGVFLDATVGYSYDAVALLADRQALARARARVASAERAGAFRALGLHAQLLRLQAAVEQERLQLAAALAGVAAAALGAPGYALEQARLGLAEARLQLEGDVRRLADRRGRAAARGLAPTARYLPLRFVLPEPDLERTSAYRLAVLEVELARAARARDLLSGTVRDLSLSASYVTGGVGLGARAGLIDGRPRAEAHVTAPGGADGWGVGVSATFVLSAAAGGAGDAARSVARAERRLAALRRDFPVRSRRLRAEARLADRELDLAERRLALARRAPGATPTATPAGGRRAQVAVLEARRGLYDAWARYLGSAYAYLDLVEAPWQARDP